MAIATGVLEGARGQLDAALGGPARRRIVVLLALVLGLDAADKATLGAVAAELQRSLGLSSLQLGVLASAALAVAGLATVPIGVLTDRVPRTKLLVVTIAAWGLTMIVAGAASSFAMLLVARLALGGVSATAGPTVASLAGDWFPARDRGTIYGYVLTGEIVGAGFGFVVAGELTAVLSWRWGFWALVLPALGLSLALRRWMPEPARGGASRLPEGAEEVHGADEVADEDGTPDGDDEDHDLTLAQRVASDREDVEARDALVLEEPPERMSLRRAMRYVLAIPSNRLLIVISALGWFFFAGVRTFGLIFVRGEFDLGQSTATGLFALIGIGGLVGVLIGGRASDAVIARGRLNGRVLVAVAGYGLTPVLLAPAFLSTALWTAVPLFFAGTMALGAANPPADAGRLDVMHHRLWGRAESVRTVARTWAEASAPIVFGLVAQLLGGGSRSVFATEGAARHGGGHAATGGLRDTFLIMLVPVVVGALLGLRMLRTYPHDVATAAESEQRAEA